MGADKRQDALQQRDDKREDEREVTEFGDHDLPFQ
jgi:hypothetical protein